jgi:hypothetical protein
MTELAIRPMQWAHVRDLHECAPLAADDLACMSELRAVLARHGKLARFAVHLIHKHFDMSPDEILVEYSDAATREQYFRVEKRDADATRDAIPTTWTLEHNEPLIGCVCAYRINQGHLGRHETG